MVEEADRDSDYVVNPKVVSIGIDQEDSSTASPTSRITPSPNLTFTDSESSVQSQAMPAATSHPSAVSQSLPAVTAKIKRRKRESNSSRKST